jgi:hypothetical protein
VRGGDGKLVLSPRRQLSGGLGATGPGLSALAGCPLVTMALTGTCCKCCCCWCWLRDTCCAGRP